MFVQQSSSILGAINFCTKNLGLGEMNDAQGVGTMIIDSNLLAFFRFQSSLFRAVFDHVTATLLVVPITLRARAGAGKAAPRG